MFDFFRAVKVEVNPTSSPGETQTMNPVTSFTFLSTRTTQRLTTQKAETTGTVQITEEALNAVHTEEVSGTTTTVTSEFSTTGVQSTLAGSTVSSDMETPTTVITSDIQVATVIKRNIQMTSPSVNSDETRVTTIKSFNFEPTKSPGNPETSSKESNVFVKQTDTKVNSGLKKTSPPENLTNSNSATTKMPHVLSDGSQINEKGEIQDQKASATLQPALVSSDPSQGNETADYVAKGEFKSA